MNTSVKCSVYGLDRKVMLCLCRIVLFPFCSMALGVLNAEEVTADELEWSAGSSSVLSQDASNADQIFTGVDIADYEPVYVCYDRGSQSGNRWFVNQDLHNQILRAYRVVKAEENGVRTMTVQFQGVVRTTVTMPYTACVTVKFVQNGDNVDAYQISAASLKPLDVELGIDIDAMLAAEDSRVVERPYKNIGSGGRVYFNVSKITMRKPMNPVSYAVKNGGSVSGVISGNGVVTVSNAVVDTVGRSDYLPTDKWVVVAENRNLSDLDEVTGGYRCDALFLTQKAYNLKYTSVMSNFGTKSCQFQYDTGGNGHICCLPVLFRQNGVNIEAKTSRWMMYYIRRTAGGADQIKLGMDFEKYDGNSIPKREIYGNNVLAESDNDNGKMGVRDLVLKFHSRPTVSIDEYLPNTFDEGIDKWIVVAENHSLSDLVEMEAFYHNTVNKGYYVPGLNLKISGESGSVQFQDKPSDLLACISVYLRQKGNNIESRTGRYNNNYFKTGTDYPELVYGFDFGDYKNLTAATRYTYGKGSFADSDDDNMRGIKYLRMRFAMDGIAYSAACTAKYGNELVFSGSKSLPLSIRTVSTTAFPSNGIVKINPYATLTVSDHVKNPIWTKYQVMTNGVLKLKGNMPVTPYEHIYLVGGTLFINEEEDSIRSSNAYINYVTLMNGASIKGKLARVSHDSINANWIVTGDSPSYCDSGIVVTGKGGDNESVFNINVNDVCDGSDFFISGDIVDYHTITTIDGYWNVHVVKNGNGTLELSGGVTLPNEICVSNGVLRLAASDQFKISRKRQQSGENTKAAIWLAGGGLETASGTVNSIGALVVKEADSPLVLGNGSTLTLASCSFEEGASLLVSDNLGSGATLRIESGSISKIRCGADRLRVRVGADGGLEPFIPGFQISIR